MAEKRIKHINWNPWHGCTKISAGCRYCYVYRADERRGNALNARICHKTADFNLPVKRGRDRNYKVPPGSYVYTCFTSDFLLENADPWRDECWKMIKERSDCKFYFFTKRIDRFLDCIPDDWGDGYDNVAVGCTVENQDRADYRLPIFMSLPIKHKSIIIGPMLEAVDISGYLDESIEQVAVSGESGIEARNFDFDWALDVRRQCVEANVSFFFHQTGAHFIKDGKFYDIPRKLQHSQARKANIDYHVRKKRRSEAAGSGKRDFGESAGSGKRDFGESTGSGKAAKGRAGRTGNGGEGKPGKGRDGRNGNNGNGDNSSGYEQLSLF